MTLLPEGGGRYDIAKAIWRAEHADFTPEQTWAWRREGLTEAARRAGEYGVTLALQNHKPVIEGYTDVLRMVREVASPNLKVCFDARLEHEMDQAAVERAVHEIGPLQVLWHYGGEYDRGPEGIVVTGDEKALGEAKGLLAVGYRGYAGFELCHPLPLIDGQAPGLDFVDKNAVLAAEYMRSIIREAKSCLSIPSLT